MCGRYTLFTPEEAIAELLGATVATSAPAEWELPRYNIAPTEPVPIARINSKGELVLEWVRWGLVPFFRKGPKDGPLLINARSEGVAKQPAFREAYAHRRCVVPANGFFEWKEIPRVKGKPHKQPYFIHPTAGGLVLFAGLWELWKPAPTEDAPAPEPLRSCTIITTPANEAVSALHDRMPAVLSPEMARLWLDPNTEPQMLPSLLVSAPNDVMQMHAVSAEVNHAKNEGRELIEPVADEEQPEPRKTGQMRLL